MHQTKLIAELIDMVGSVKVLSEITNIRVQRWYEWKKGKHEITLNTYLESLEKVKATIK